MDKPIARDMESLKGQLDQAQKELSVLYDISNAMRTTLELNHIMYIILTGVTSHEGLGFNRAILFLVNKHERCLETKMAIGPASGEHADQIWTYIKESDQKLEDLIAADKLSLIQNSSTLYEAVKNLKIPLYASDGSLLAMAFHKGTPLLLRGPELDPYRNSPLLQTFHSSELIVAPLKGKEKIIGLIVADNLFTQKPITPQDVKIFVMLANQAGLAIENSQLYEMVVQKSHTDSITQVWNHGFFQHILSEEMEKTQKSSEKLTLLMIDIDNFKKFNDTYGHQNGDILLRELATLLKKSSRDRDFVCRYGGEEFSIVLTQTSKEQGFDIAERMREEIAHHDFSKFHLNQNLNITVSIGLATFPDDAQSKEELIAKADKTMYIAKFAGKNQTCVTDKEKI